MNQEEFKLYEKDAQKALLALMREINKRCTAVNVTSIDIRRADETYVAVVKEGEYNSTTLFSSTIGYSDVDAIWLSDELSALLKGEED
jgi:hypothetical protein